MHNNFHFLKQLVPAISEKISGLSLMEAFSQDKNEIVFCFAAVRGKNKHYKEFFIKAVVDSKFSGLYFSDEFRRAKKNTVSLMADAYDNVVENVIQFENERCFSVVLSNGFQLLFKLFGNRSNLILFKDHHPIFLFNSKFENDKTLSISTLNRKIDQSFDAFIQAEGNINKLFPTFGKQVINYLKEDKNFTSKSLDIQWKTIVEVNEKLNSGNYYVTKIENEFCLCLLPIGEIIEEHTDPIKANNSFFIKYNQYEGLDDERYAIIRELKREKKQTEAYIENSYARLEVLEELVSNEQKGHIIMANLHEINAQQTEVTLTNFYTEQPITLKLKKDLSPQKNAETYYRKAKNEKIEVETISKNIAQKETRLGNIDRFIVEINEIDNLKKLRNYLKINNLYKKENQEHLTLPFNRYEVEGFELLVGKNAKSNDTLLKKYSYKEDLWMHVRDAAGSHVLLKYQAGKKFPNYIIEKAAAMAAYHSKRRLEGLVPVIVTPKKFVRKLKGMAAGQVIVDKEEVVMVAPENLSS